MPPPPATTVFPIRAGLPGFLNFLRKVIRFGRIPAYQEIAEKAE
jgi:hypothetical protein